MQELAAASEKTRMTVSSLCIVLAPNVFQSGVADIPLTPAALKHVYNFVCSSDTAEGCIEGDHFSLIL